MLQLVLGGSGSGKTTLLYHRIRARAEAGQKSILLVPEQFTSSTEGRIYRELGDALSGMVESFSFTSLAEKILSVEGGAAVQTLSDAGRAVLVRRALEELQENVHYYYRNRRSAAFCQMAAETIDELKSAGLSGQQLADLAKGCGAESGKLGELALIFQGYETLLARSGMDPADRLELAGARLEEALACGAVPGFLQEREVFIDEFDTFNAPKKRLLGALLAALPRVTVALCDDGAPLVPGDVSLFSGAKQVAVQLRQLARKNGAEVAAPQLLRRDLRHTEAPGLAAVTALLETGTCAPLEAPTDEVRLFAAPSREEEARAAAGAIRRLMRQGVRCGRIAVVCRDIGKYRAAVRYEFRMAGISLYCDEPTTPEFSAPGHGGPGTAGAGPRGRPDRESDHAGQNGPVRPDRRRGLRPRKLRLYLVAQCGGMAGSVPERPQRLRRSGADRRGRPEPVRCRKGPRSAGERRRCPARQGAERQRRGHQPGALLLPQRAGRRGTAGGAGGSHPRGMGHPGGGRGRPRVERGHGAAGRDGPPAGRADRDGGRIRRPVRAVAALVRPGGISRRRWTRVLASAGKMRLDEPDYVFVLGLAEGEFPRPPARRAC